jgi:general secretion pathway protein E
MSATAIKLASGQARAVTLEDVLDDLLADEVVEAEQANILRSVVSVEDRRKRNPLQIIADRHWLDARHPGQKLTLDQLSEWFAAKADLPLYRIDPLKIDVPSITGVMSYAYASRFGILLF